MKNHNLSHHNQQVFASLQSVVSTLPLPLSQFQRLVMEVKFDQDSTANSITSHTDHILKKLLMTLLTVEVDISSPDWVRKCGLPQVRLKALKQVLESVCGGAASQNIKRSVVISFIENVLQCLGVSDLAEVLDVISAQIPRFASNLEETDELKLLRVINVLLKTVSKTEDYHLRGQLHLTLTRFLPFCHDSGFHFRAQAVKTSEWESVQSIQEQEQLVNGLSYQFYQQFWQLQKWLIEPSELVAKEGLFTHLKQIEQTLKQIQDYFQKHSANENPEYYSQPIKYLKNYNLLALQLGDLTFRKTIMLQVLLFTHALKNPMTKTPITLSDSQKKIIPEIQVIPKKFLSSCCGEDGRNILEQLPHILGSEQEWMSIKEQWKDRKKSILNKAQEQSQVELKSREEIKKQEKQMEKRRIEARKRISQKMKIEGYKIQQFLENDKSINLQSTPTYTSFSYFFSQAVNCLKTFDRQNGKQNEFQTRAEYNMFEWKAMRSLYRENIRDIWSTSDKAPPKMKQFRLISLLSRKQDQFVEPEAQKKIKRE